MSVKQIVITMKFIAQKMKFIMLKELEKKISNFISTEIEWVPLNSVKVAKDKKDDLVSFFETLEDDDDIQNIYSNVELEK